MKREVFLYEGREKKMEGWVGFWPFYVTHTRAGGLVGAICPFNILSWLIIIKSQKKDLSDHSGYLGYILKLIVYG